MHAETMTRAPKMECNYYSKKTRSKQQILGRVNVGAYHTYSDFCIANKKKACPITIKIRQKSIQPIEA